MSNEITSNKKYKLKFQIPLDVEGEKIRDSLMECSAVLENYDLGNLYIFKGKSRFNEPLDILVLLEKPNTLDSNDKEEVYIPIDAKNITGRVNRKEFPPRRNQNMFGEYQ